MLAGLLFATQDAEDRPDRLAATLPFAGSTLIEHQARLLLSAGVGQIVVVVARLTPDLLGTLGRLGRRGVTVDAVRNAAEAAERLHPLSRVLVLADGLVTTDAVVRRIADEGADVLLVLEEAGAGPEFERIGGRLAWAGAAGLCQARLREAAALPRDYDLQSTLLRTAAQAGAAHLLLPATAGAEGHGIEHRAAPLEARERAVLASAMSGAHGWFDRWIAAPIGRVALPGLGLRQVPTAALSAGGAALGAGGLVAISGGLPTLGLALAAAALIVWALGGALAGLRDQNGWRRCLSALGMVLPVSAALLLGWTVSEQTAEATALVAAIGLVILGGLSERAIAVRARALAWGSPGAFLLVLFAGAAIGRPLAGLLAAAGYAAITAGLAIEALRRRD